MFGRRKKKIDKIMKETVYMVGMMCADGDVFEKLFQDECVKDKYICGFLNGFAKYYFILSCERYGIDYKPIEMGRSLVEIWSPYFNQDIERIQDFATKSNEWEFGNDMEYISGGKKGTGAIALYFGMLDENHKDYTEAKNFAENYIDIAREMRITYDGVIEYSVFISWLDQFLFKRVRSICEKQ